MINLLPPQAKESIKYGRYNVIVIHYLLISAFTVMTVVSLMLFGKAALQSVRDDLEIQIADDQVRIAELKLVDAEAQQLSNTVSTIDQLLDKEIKFSILLQEIGSIIPSGASVSALTLSNSQEEPVALTVFIDTAEKAGVLQENLIASDLFISADILSVSRAADAGQYEYTASLQAYYDPSLPLNTIDDASDLNTDGEE